MQLLSIDPQSAKQKVMFEAKDPGLPGTSRVMEFLGKDQFLINSDRDGFNRIYRCTTKGCQALSPKARDVTEFYGYDRAKKWCYYQIPEKMHHTNEKSLRTDRKGRSEVLSKQKGWNSLTFQSTNDLLHPQRAGQSYTTYFFPVSSPLLRRFG